ncbi:VQ motif-containing protein 20 [Malania oleifera]|uniref:VQ motif-containing protein 20 n=1 Tax=Malania oleifera TaxID=397392 RepID=UPI0025AEC1D2|nr:VQ motif-containing protein 20 [Malania oleifera]
MSHPELSHEHEKRGANHVTATRPSLKISKDSHSIKKPPPSSPPSSSSSVGGAAAASKPHQQRHPVIIYTHSPKVIHTHPRDFMALVQKLTGLSHSASDDDAPPHAGADKESRNAKGGAGDENDTSSVITEENGCDLRVNSANCMVPPFFESAMAPTMNPYLCNMPFLGGTSTDFLCSNQQQPFYNSYNESLIFSGAPNMRMMSSISSSSTLDGLSEFREF